MEMKIPAIAITAVVVVIVLAGVLMPVLDDATAKEDTFTNEGYTRMSETSDTIVITWTPSVDRNTIKINDVDYDLLSFPKTWNTSYSIAFSDDFILRVYMDGAGADNIQIWQSGYRNGASKSSTYTATFTISDSAVTFNSGAPDATTSSYTHSGSSFVMDTDGDYIMKDKAKSAYILKDSSIVYAGGISAISSSVSSGMYFEGTLNNLEFYPMQTLTVSNVQCDYTEDSDYIDLVSLNKITFDTTYSDATVSQTYSYFLVPYEVSAERAVHFTDNENAIFAAIPIMVIVALLIAVVALVFRGRDF